MSGYSLPDYHWENEPEFECTGCMDTGYAEPGEFCPYCSKPVTLDDLEELALEEK